MTMSGVYNLEPIFVKYKKKFKLKARWALEFELNTWIKKMSTKMIKKIKILICDAIKRMQQER